MDTGRRLTLVEASLAVAALATLAATPSLAAAPPPAAAAATPSHLIAPQAAASHASRPRAQSRHAPRAQLRREAGPAAIAAARRHATERAEPGRFVGGLLVFAYAPGAIYEVWTAPLRVTSISLGPDETLSALAAGDTVRWQIGQTTSGEGATRRVHVLVKPLARGLATNLLLTTNRRVYLVALRSSAAPDFNPAVAWSPDALDPPKPPPPPPPAPELQLPPEPPPFDARYRILPKGRPPAWTPTTVMTDGRRTLIAFPPGLAATEAPILVVLGPGGERQMVNYRQSGGLFVVDRVLDRAELRLGDRRPEIVRLERAAGDAP